MTEQCVEVKPLEWKDGDGLIVRVAEAHTLLTIYYVFDKDETGNYCLMCNTNTMMQSSNLQKIEAAAQLDYEECLLLAINARPASEVYNEGYNKAIEDAATHIYIRSEELFYFNNDVLVSKAVELQNVEFEIRAMKRGEG